MNDFERLNEEYASACGAVKILKAALKRAEDERAYCSAQLVRDGSDRLVDGSPRM